MGGMKRLAKRAFHAIGFEVIRLPALPQEHYQLFPPKDKEFIWLGRLDVKTVLDIGANTGQFARKIHQLLPHAAIISFEPLQSCLDDLERNMKDVPNVRAIGCALGEENAQVQFYRNAFSLSSSVLPMTRLHKEAFPCTETETTERVAMRRLDDVVRDLSLRDNILVKLDVQGSEGKVISGGRTLLSRAKVVIVETSFFVLYKGQPLFDDIYSMLMGMGFKFMGMLDQIKSPIDGTILQADALFLKEDSVRILQ